VHGEELEIARRLGAAIWIADALAHLGRAMFLSDDLTGARSRLEEAVETAGECAEKAVFPLLTLAELALRARRPDDALAAVARVRLVAGAYRILQVEARCLEAAAWALLGRHPAAETALREIVCDADRYELRPTRWRAGLDLAELLRARGADDEGRREARDVRARLEAFGHELPDALARTFRQSALVLRASALASAATT